MGNPILKELKELKKVCDDMLESDRHMFENNDNFMGIAEKACYKAFYQIAADIIKRYEELEEKEAADYENFLCGGNKNEI